MGVSSEESALKAAFVRLLAGSTQARPGWGGRGDGGSAVDVHKSGPASPLCSEEFLTFVKRNLTCCECKHRTRKHTRALRNLANLANQANLLAALSKTETEMRCIIHLTQKDNTKRPRDAELYIFKTGFNYGSKGRRSEDARHEHEYKTSCSRMSIKGLTT